VDAEILQIVDTLTSAVSMLATFLVAVVAVVVAVVLTLRKVSRVAAWALALAWTCAGLVDVGHMLVGLVLSPRLGWEASMWAYVALGVTNLLVGCVTAVAFVLFRAPRGEAARG
jgi:uncharacterized protein (DUF983 family)